MRPTQSRRTRSARRQVVIGALAVALGIAGMVGFSVLANEGTVEVNLGDDELDAGRAKDIADSAPILFSDLIGGTVDLYVQHAGGDVDKGWTAFSARAPGQRDRGCSLVWNGKDFEDPCTKEQFPADGAGLRAYPTRVSAGRVLVNLREPG